MSDDLDADKLGADRRSAQSWFWRGIPTFFRGP